MKKQVIYFLIGLFIILFSSPLGHMATSLVYYNKNLAAEYAPILNGYIHSFMLIGALVAGFGFIDELVGKSE